MIQIYAVIKQVSFSVALLGKEEAIYMFACFVSIFLYLDFKAEIKRYGQHRGCPSFFRNCIHFDFERMI